MTRVTFALVTCCQNERVTDEHARRVRFGRAPFGHRGYDAAEVDAFCERVAEAHHGRGMLTATEIREHEFATAAFGHRGYDRDEVDDYLDRACMDLEFARRGTKPHPIGNTLLTPEDVQRLRFSAPPHGQPGYAADEVSLFLNRLATTLAHGGPNGLTSAEVRNANFGLARAGTAAYHIEEVDSFLDVAVRTLAAQESGGEPRG
ncbi:DivIVA domain-containing protein [Nocardia mexicana]|uniref:Cell wall synthesis protein Wag31 n=1 Tax=Nocardia mexicana TaxID=279262 RepID=A0A370H354_9NOCA|nr:DivIVA domain-containing protein [Nocardia mexicana]